MKRRLPYLTLFTLLMIASLKPVFGQERKYEVYCSSGVGRCAGYQTPPLEIVEVRHLQNEHWMRDMEVEVKNISSKPIYRISLGMEIPDLGSEDFTYGFSLKYGEDGSWSVGDIARPGDISLKPGETYVFRVIEGVWKGFENYMAKTSLPESVTKRIVFQFHAVSFGDGTGFEAGRFITRR